MIAAYLTAMRRYGYFNGRTARGGLWWFKLVTAVLCLAALRIDGFIFGGTNDEQAPLFLIMLLAHLLPVLAADVRRLHDMDQSGWFVLVGLIPLVGPVILLVWLCQPGTPGPNRFGPDPLADAATHPNGARDPLAAGRGGRPVGAAMGDPLAEIERLAHLRTCGTLSEVEFETLKTRVLAGAGQTLRATTAS